MIISGIAEFDGGVVADSVYLYSSSTGFIGALIDSASLGGDPAYSFTVPDIGPYHVKITGAGQIPLMHGPVNAV